jgi:hypothetical protein
MPSDARQEGCRIGARRRKSPTRGRFVEMRLSQISYVSPTGGAWRGGASASLAGAASRMECIAFQTSQSTKRGGWPSTSTTWQHSDVGCQPARRSSRATVSTCWRIMSSQPTVRLGAAHDICQSRACAVRATLPRTGKNTRAPVYLRARQSMDPAPKEKE